MAGIRKREVRSPEAPRMTIVAITPQSFSDHLGRTADGPLEMRVSIPFPSFIIV
jgi:hypothetical protein